MGAELYRRFFLELLTPHQTPVRLNYAEIWSHMLVQRNVPHNVDITFSTDI